MSQEDSFSLVNFKGTLSYSPECVSRVIHKIADYTVKFSVKQVIIERIEKFNHWLFIIEMQKNYDVDYFDKLVANYRQHLANQIESSLNIHNFDLILAFK